MPTTDKSNTERTRRRRCQAMANGYFPRGTPKDTTSELERKFGDYKYFVDGKLSGIYPQATVVELTCETEPITLNPTVTYVFKNTNTSLAMLVIDYISDPFVIPPGGVSEPRTGVGPVRLFGCGILVNLTCGQTVSLNPESTKPYLLKNTDATRYMEVLLDGVNKTLIAPGSGVLTPDPIPPSVTATCIASTTVTLVCATSAAGLDPESFYIFSNPTSFTMDVQIVNNEGYIPITLQPGEKTVPYTGITEWAVLACN